MKIKLLILFSFLCSLLHGSEMDDVQIVSRHRAPEWKSFSLSEVRLNDSYFKEAMERHKGYVLSLDVDRLIPHVRKRVGLEPKGETYGGWEKGGGCTYGHYLSSCALFYAATGDERFLQRLDYMLSELQLCQQHVADGWFVTGTHARDGYNDLLKGRLLLDQPDETGQPWNFNRNGNSWYCIHKVLAGLRDAYVYAGREKAREILLPLSAFIANVALNANSDLFQGMLAVEAGGMNEVFADIYAITGDEKYLKTAQRFNHINVIYPVANGEDVLFGRHANDQIPKFVGIIREYELTDEDLYMKAARNFWDIVVNAHTVAIGGNSCYERFGIPGQESKRLDYSSAETCNTYNMLKLSRHLFMQTGDMKYLNYYEHALYNHILASQDPDRAGCVTYYTSLLPGLFKQYSTPYDSFWCCVGTGLENHAKYAESVYFEKDGELLVNLYIPSELQDKATGLKLKLITRYPESDTIRVRIGETGSFAGTLAFRIPEWLQSGPEVFVNGTKKEGVTEKNSYIRLNDRIESGDVVTLVLPRSLHIRYVKDEPHYGTVMYGPLVLAGELGRENMPEDRVSDNRYCKDAQPVKNIPMLVGDTENPASWILEEDGSSLHFIVKNGGRQPAVSLIPYFQMHHQYHTVYWKIYSDELFRQRAVALTDEVKIADTSNEKKHNLLGEGDSVCWHDYFWAKNTQYRVAENGGWFSYDLKIDRKETKPYYLICRFWGDESPEHKFDILVDGKLLKSVDLHRRLFLTYVDDVYKIPREWTAGKNKVTVRFQSGKGKTAGGLYRLVITSDPDLR